MFSDGCALFPAGNGHEVNASKLKLLNKFFKKSFLFSQRFSFSLIYSIDQFPHKLKKQFFFSLRELRVSISSME